MTRILLFFSLFTIAALFAWILVQNSSTARGPAEIPSLLPAETALLLQVPDVDRTIAAWRRTDLHALLQEPQVIEFLREPVSQLISEAALANLVRDLQTLQIRDFFLASLDLDRRRLVGGFKFRCSNADAGRIVREWQSRLLPQFVQSSSIERDPHHVELLACGNVQIATVLVEDRLFLATAPDDLLELLDRIDRRTSKPALSRSKEFRAALRQVPPGYAWSIFLRPSEIARGLSRLRVAAGDDPAGHEHAALRSMHDLIHCVTLENGEMREIDFATMPQSRSSKLNPNTLPFASADTVFYLASVLNASEQWKAFAGSGLTGSRLGTGPLCFSESIKEHWQAAFGDELTFLCDWPARRPIPSLRAILPVKESDRAKDVVSAVAPELKVIAGKQADETQWRGSGVFGPRISLRDNHLVVVAAAPGESESRPTKVSLTSTVAYREATRQLPEPEHLFAYLDIGLFYERFESMLRPLLSMSAAFVPRVSQTFFRGKLPSSALVKRHPGAGCGIAKLPRWRLSHGVRWPSASG